jgi:hypothetical protein
MKRILTTEEHYAIKKALWEDVKRLPMPRKDRLLFRDQLYLDYLATFERFEEDAPLDKEREGERASDSGLQL